MCECGCSSDHTILELPAPNGLFYLLEFSSGCEDCETPAGVIVQRVKPDSPHREFSAGQFQLHKDRYGHYETAVGLVYAHEVYKFVVRKLCETFDVKELFHARELDNFDEQEFKTELYELFSKSVHKGLAVALPKRTP